MKKLHKLFTLLFALVFCILFTWGCGKKAAECPFTTITWEHTLEDIQELEGTDSEAYDSTVYGGPVYDQIHKEAEDMLGKSGFKYNSDRFSDLASPGDVWYLETGNVILNTVDAEDIKILQYSFLHPDVSEGNPQDSKK